VTIIEPLPFQMVDAETSLWAGGVSPTVSAKAPSPVHIDDLDLDSFEEEPPPRAKFSDKQIAEAWGYMPVIYFSAFL
jgi:hypothetical protein